MSEIKHYKEYAPDGVALFTSDSTPDRFEIHQHNIHAAVTRVTTEGIFNGWYHVVVWDTVKGKRRDQEEFHAVSGRVAAKLVAAWFPYETEIRILDLEQHEGES